MIDIHSNTIAYSAAIIHPTAIIHPSAKIGENVEIGPYSIVEEETVIGNGCKIGSHVCIGSYTTMGQNNQISQGAVIGSVPLDKSYMGERVYTILGDDNVVREYTTISKGTAKGGGITQIGSGNFITSYVHIGHDVVMGDHNVVINGVQIAGHVEIEDFVTIGGTTFVHQFCKIGRHVMIGAGSKVTQDIVPYSLANGSRLSIYGINYVGLKRQGVSREDMNTVKKINSILFRQNLPLAESINLINAMPHSEFKQHTLNFLKKSKRGLTRME